MERSNQNQFHDSHNQKVLSKDCTVKWSKSDARDECKNYLEIYNFFFCVHYFLCLFKIFCCFSSYFVFIPLIYSSKFNDEK